MAALRVRANGPGVGGVPETGCRRGDPELTIVSGLRLAEVPTTLAPDGRSRPPYLRSWRDGWRHLKPAS